LDPRFRIFWLDWVSVRCGGVVCPEVGEETRRFLSDKADEGRDYAQKKARELRERAMTWSSEQGCGFAAQGTITAAVDGAREAYRREASKS